MPRKPDTTSHPATTSARRRERSERGPAATAHVSERRRPTQERARATVQAVLEAAAELICDLGYHAASTNKIAARAGVSIGSLYQYFPNKDAILTRLLEEHHLHVHAVVDRSLPTLQDPAVPLATGLGQLLSDLLELHEQEPELTRVLASEVPHPRGASDEGHDYAADVEHLLATRSDVHVAGTDVAAAIVTTTIEAITRYLAHDAPPGLDRRRCATETAAMLATYLAGDAAAGRFRPIGVVHTPFHTTQGMPIQPSRSDGAQGTVEVFPEYADGLADLDGFSHVVLLCHFHRARPFRLRVVPYLDDRERGLFATRAPSRPNPIGLSVVRLLATDGAKLRVENVDLLDGTPVLDIKPWIGELPESEAVRLGWLDEARQRRTTSDRRFGD